MRVCEKTAGQSPEYGMFHKSASSSRKTLQSRQASVISAGLRVVSGTQSLDFFARGVAPIANRSAPVLENVGHARNTETRCSEETRTAVGIPTDGPSNKEPDRANWCVL